MAEELLADRGVRTMHVAVTDDVASAPLASRTRRRGVAGDVFVLKAAGARADEGAALEDVRAAAAHANDRTRTVGVALAPCTIPAAGRPTFDLPEGTMDVGMGVHGEAGLARRELASATTLRMSCSSCCWRMSAARRRSARREHARRDAADGGSSPVAPRFSAARQAWDRPRARLRRRIRDVARDGGCLTDIGRDGRRTSAAPGLPGARARGTVTQPAVVMIDADAMVAFFDRVLFRTQEAQAELDRLDSVAGDGDHGVTMVIGWRRVSSDLASTAPLTPGRHCAARRRRSLTSAARRALCGGRHYFAPARRSAMFGRWSFQPSPRQPRLRRRACATGAAARTETERSLTRWRPRPPLSTLPRARDSHYAPRWLMLQLQPPPGLHLPRSSPRAAGVRHAPPSASAATKTRAPAQPPSLLGAPRRSARPPTLNPCRADQCITHHCSRSSRPRSTQPPLQDVLPPGT